MKKELIGTAAWAAIIAALTFGSVVARRQGYIDADTVERVTIGVGGLLFAWYGNRIPKTFTSDADARRAQRVAAWSSVLGGLVYAGLWAFAPIPAAAWGGSGVVLACVAITLGYCLVLHTRAKAA